MILPVVPCDAPVVPCEATLNCTAIKTVTYNTAPLEPIFPKTKNTLFNWIYKRL